MISPSTPVLQGGDASAMLSLTGTMSAIPTDTPTPTFTETLTPTATSTSSGQVIIDYTYDALYRLVAADYSTGDYYHYTYDAVGNRLTQESTVNGLPSTVSYAYDIANRLIDADGVSYIWDANGNLLSDGVNTYTYDSANCLISASGPFGSSTYGYNGLGDRLTQDGIQYTLDLNAGLTQVLDVGEHAYLYGLGRIAQAGTVTEYFMGDA